MNEILKEHSSHKSNNISSNPTLRLIEDLYREVNNFIFLLANNYPNNFKLSLAKLSLFWGYNKEWLGKILREKRKFSNKEENLLHGFVTNFYR